MHIVCESFSGYNAKVRYEKELFFGQIPSHLTTDYSVDIYVRVVLKKWALFAIV